MALILPDQVQSVTLRVAKISVGEQTGEVEITWPAANINKVAEFAKERWQKGKSKQVFQVWIFYYIINS